MGGRKSDRVIIIGAGLAGLSAGFYARLNGYPAHIFEHSGKPGGVVAAWKRGDYLIDGGVHFLMGYKHGQPTHDLYEELGILEDNPVIGMKDYGMYVDAARDRTLTVTADLDRLAADMKALSPADGRAVDDLVGEAKACRGFDFGLDMEKPAELMGPVDTLGQLWRMRRFMKYMVGRFSKPMDEYSRALEDPWLRWVVNNFFMPEVPVWFVIMLLAMMADGQLGLLEGGSRRLARSLEKRYRALGGDVTYRATVEKILVENNRAVGVRLADGSEHLGGVVISAADGHSTIYDMLEGRYRNRKIDERYRTWKLFTPTVMAGFGVAREFPGEPYLHLIRLSRPLNAGDERDSLMVRLFNYSPSFAPEGKTVVQAAVETSWEFWQELRKRDLEAYKARKERVAAEILDRLDERWPGLSSAVEVADVATPYTTWRYTRNRRGAFEGFVPTPAAVTARVPKALPDLKNFYMAGQWVMPGGGVPPVLFSGRHAIQLLCRSDGSDFVSRQA
jgi:phytoene desaturase